MLCSKEMSARCTTPAAAFPTVRSEFLAGWKNIENCLHAGLRVLSMSCVFCCGLFNLSQGLREKGTAMIFKCFTYVCERYHMPCCRRQPDFGVLDVCIFHRNLLVQDRKNRAVNRVAFGFAGPPCFDRNWTFQPGKLLPGD